MAQRGVNKVILLGRLGQDPEVRFFANGGSVANLRLATSEVWKDKQTGEQREKTEWHSVAVFGKLAEIAGQYLKKGSQVYIEGQLQTRKWQDQSGQDRYTTEVVVNIGGVMQLLGGANNNSSYDNSSSPSPSWGAQNNQNANTYSPPSQSQNTMQNEPPIEFDDDIPF